MAHKFATVSFGCPVVRFELDGKATKRGADRMTGSRRWQPCRLPAVILSTAAEGRRAMEVEWKS
jgi:hypothetical protein